MNIYIFFMENTQNITKIQIKLNKIKRLLQQLWMHVKTVMHETSVVHLHNTAKQSQKTDQNYKNEYNKRTSIEEPFRILKEQFQIKKEIIIGMIKTEERIKNTHEDLKDFQTDAFY